MSKHCKLGLVSLHSRLLNFYQDTAAYKMRNCLNIRSRFRYCMATPTLNQVIYVHQKIDNDSDQLWEEEKAGLFFRLFPLYFYSNFTHGNCGLWVMWILGKGILIISFFENSADNWQNGGTIKNRAIWMLRFFIFPRQCLLYSASIKFWSFL